MRQSRTQQRKLVRLAAPMLFMWGLGFCLAATPSRADEFATIPANDPIYASLNELRQSSLGSEKASPARSAPRYEATRYEVAVETARALLKVTNNRQGLSGSRAPLRALRKLTEALRPELMRLGLNVDETLRKLNGLISDGAPTVDRSAPASGNLLLKTEPSDNLVGGKVNLSQRLRIYSTFSALARDAQDPFGDTANFGARQTASVARPGTLGAAVSGSEAISSALPKESLIGGVEAGAALSLTNWMQVRANYAQSQLTPNTVAGDFRLRAPLLDGAHESRSVGTGVDIALLNGVRFSGDVSRISALSSGGDITRTGTRFGGALNMSAWQNRLSLNANISRLVPEDADALVSPSTAAEFNLGADVTRRLSLNLRYQQMFAAPGNARTDRVVSGGLSVKF